MVSILSREWVNTTAQASLIKSSILFLPNTCILLRASWNSKTKRAALFLNNQKARYVTLSCFVDIMKKTLTNSKKKTTSMTAELTNSIDKKEKTTSMTAESPGKPSLSPRTLNMIFNSSDSTKMENNFGSGDSVFRSGDSVFRSADFLRSLEAYKDSLSNGASSLAGADPSSFFKSVDFLKSLDSLDKSETSKSAASSKPVAKTASAPKDMLTSRDWIVDYEKAHKDIKYDKALFQSGESGKVAASPIGSATMSSSDSFSKWMKLYEEGLNSAPSPAAAVAPQIPVAASMAKSWSGMYDSVLRDPMQNIAASAPMPSLAASAPVTVIPAPVASITLATNDNKNATKPKKKRIYKSRKVIPENKVFVEFTDKDVLLGRGGLSNKHPGNARYRKEIENTKSVYRSASKDEKTQWASLLVEYVQKYGGRFLEKDKETGKWYIVPDIVARRKAGQALREDNTAEARRAKREKYKKKHNKG